MNPFRPVASFFLAAMLTGVAIAQTQTTHEHSAQVDDRIDGSVHPELIPDNVAWRLYLLTVSENPVALPNETKRQNARLKNAGLEEAHIQAMVPILADFKVQYSALIELYNKSPEVTANTNDGLALFLLKRDALVQKTRHSIKSSLPDAVNAKLEAHVKEQKAHMKVAAKEGVQP